eukprot:COSAG02_NODE_3049_length_7469_cov_357.503121_3_plen_110_part_00
MTDGANGVSPRRGQSHSTADLAVVLVGTHPDKFTEHGQAPAVSAADTAKFCCTVQERLGGHAVYYHEAAAIGSEGWAASVQAAFGKACVLAYAISQGLTSVLDDLDAAY